MTVTITTCTAVYEHDAEDGVWLVELQEEPRCHTWGKTLAAAKRAIREAAGLWFDEVEVEDQVRPPAVAREEVELARRLRREAERAKVAAQLAIENAARSLREAGFSSREAGEVVGLSHQRVNQLEMQYRSADRRSTVANKAVVNKAVVSNNAKAAGKATAGSRRVKFVPPS